MPGVVSADLFERAVPMLPLLSTFGSQKHFKCNSHLESLAQNLLIITMVFVLVLFANDVFDVGHYVVCYENSTVVKQKDINICVESMKGPNETQAPEFLMLQIGIFLGLMFLINRIWELCFQNWIRKHVEEMIYELNDSVYRAMMVNISENTERPAHRISIYKKILTLHIEDISPMNSRRCNWITCLFVTKNAAYCGVAVALSKFLNSMVHSYNEESEKCNIENRNLSCTVPEYKTLKSIQIIAIVCSLISILTIFILLVYTLFNINSKWTSFLAAYNRNIIPHYNYVSLKFRSKCSCAWGVILYYLNENQSMLTHYGYLNSLYSIREITDPSETTPLLPNREQLTLLKEMKQRVLIDAFDRDLPDRVQSLPIPGSQRRRSISF